ncbi:MAG: serine protease [Oligoflexales bacterium]|nr:serine protease [Oligoflexales bacterium]
MLRLTIIFILLQHLSSCARPNSDLNKPQIYGGINSTKSYPFFVGLHSVKNKFHVPIYCGASQIAPGVVLTAAHCVEYHAEEFKNKYISDTKVDVSDLKLLFNVRRISDLNRAIKVDVKKIVLHDKYTFMGANKFGYDLALLFYNKNHTDSRIRNITLANVETELNNFYSFHKVVGFGRTSKYPPSYPTTDYPDTLQETLVPRFDIETCALNYKKFGTNITDDYLCFGDERRDSCGGDSGGPLFTELSNGSNLLVGVTSGGPKDCGTLGLPGYFMRVSAFRQWIDETIRKNTL